MSAKENLSGSWDEYAKLVLKSLSNLEDRMNGIDERLSAMESRLSAIETQLQHALQNQVELRKDVDTLKMFRVQAMAIFTAVQFIFGLVIAFKDKLFGK